MTATTTAMHAADDLLLCTEEGLVEDDASLLGAPPIDLHEVLSMLLQQEACKDRVQRSATYLADVQVDGMEVAWRRKICHWMFETGKAFDLAKDTVGCAVHYMDQYLSTTSADKVLLQLLSMVCLFVAAKIHESQPISMVEMDLLSQNKFTRDDIRSVEKKLAKALDWRLAPPVSFTFARDFIQSLHLPNAQELVDDVFAFLVDVTEDYSSLRFKSSNIGIAAVYVVANTRQLLPVAAAKNAFRALNLDADELVDCCRWLNELYLLKHPSHHASVDGTPTAMVTLKRSISPSSVDDISVIAPHAAAVGASTDRVRAAASKKVKRRLDALARGDDEGKSGDAVASAADGDDATDDAGSHKRARVSA